MILTAPPPLQFSLLRIRLMPQIMFYLLVFRAFIQLLFNLEVNNSIYVLFQQKLTDSYFFESAEKISFFFEGIEILLLEVNFCFARAVLLL